MCSICGVEACTAKRGGRGSLRDRSTTDRDKQPYRICLAGEAPFSFAGLWEFNKGLDVTSGSIITTEPNEVAGAIHNWKPVIVPPTDYDA